MGAQQEKETKGFQINPKGLATISLNSFLIKLSKPAYYSGEMLSGTIFLIISKTQLGQMLKLSLRGFEQVKFQYTSEGGNFLFSDTSYGEKVIFYES